MANVVSSEPDQARQRRPIRSYVLRQGRLTDAQKRALEECWPDYGVEFHGQAIRPGDLFPSTAPVTLEIGFGSGDSLLEQALAQPQRNYIGIEVHRPGVGHLLHRAREAGIANLRVFNHDAVEVLAGIENDSLDCIQLFFPDPWHKKRHHKRRILQPSFIREAHRCLTANGRFHLATDWQDYAEYMMRAMEAAEGFINTAGTGAYAEHTGRPRTRFERRGRLRGHVVRDLVFRKHATG